MENHTEASVHRDSQRDAVFETPASDSDSGESLFLTQLVTSATRTAQRPRPSEALLCPFNQESDEEQERNGGANTQHENSREWSDRDSGTSFCDLRGWGSPVNTGGGIQRQPWRKQYKVPVKRTVFPFLEKFGSTKLSFRKSQVIVNAEIGGFFKCIKKLKKGHRKKRRELSPCDVPTEWELRYLEENEDDNEDIRKMNTELFVLTNNKSKIKSWQESMKWKSTQASRNNTAIRKKRKKEQRTIPQDHIKPQDVTDLPSESSSRSVSQVSKTTARKDCEKCRKSLTGDCFSHCSSTCHLSPKKSPFVQSLLMDDQEEHTKNQPQVLVKCSQSQTVDWNQAMKMMNQIESIDEMAVEETQWSGPDQDDDETLILEDDSMGKDGMQEGVHCEGVENEDLNNNGGSLFCSQDLFQEPDHQASLMKEAIRIHAYTALPLENCAGSKGNNSSSSSKDILIVKQEEKTKTPLFNYGGLKLLKRKKRKRPAVFEILENMAPVQVGPCTDEVFGPYLDGAVKLKKRKKIKNHGLLKEQVGNLQELNVSPDLNLSFQDSSAVYVSVNTIKQNKRRKKEKHDQSIPQDDKWIGVEEAVHITNQGSASLVSIPGGTGQLTTSDLVVQVNNDHHQLDGLKPQRKKGKKRGSSRMMSEEMVFSPCSDESQSGHGHKTVKEKKPKSFNNVSLKEVENIPSVINSFVKPLDNIISEIPEGLEVEPVNNVDLKTVDFVTAKKKKQERQMSMGENMDVKALLVETIRQEETSITIQNSEQQAHEVVPVRKEKKNKRDRTDICQKEQTSTNAAVSLKLRDTTEFCVPSTRNETGGIGEEEGLDGSEPANKERKKKKEKRDRTEMHQEEQASTNVAVIFEFGDITGFCMPSTRNETERNDEEKGLGRSEPVKKKKKKKRKNEKRHRTEAHQEEQASTNEADSLELGDFAGFCMPSTRNETGGLDDEAGLGGSEPVKKKKKEKRDRTEAHEEQASKNAADSVCMPSTRHENGGIDEGEGLGGSEQVVKKKKKKEKRNRTETNQEEQASTNAADSVCMPSTRHETGRIDDEEGLGGSEPVKKKKKEKRNRTETNQEEQASTNAAGSVCMPSTRHETGGIDDEAGLGGSEPVKKKKKEKRDRTEAHEEEQASKNAVDSVCMPSTRHETGGTDEEEALGGSEAVKNKKKKEKRDRTEVYQKEQASPDVSMYLGFELGDTTTSSTSINRNHTGGIGVGEGLGRSNQVKKKKKKWKELENVGL